MSSYDIMQKGKKCFDEGQYLESINLFDKILERDSNHFEALLYRADALFKIEDFDEAERCIDKILKEVEWENSTKERIDAIAAVLRTKTEILISKKKFSEASICIDEIEYHCHNSIPTLLLKGVLQFEQGNLENALRTFEEIEKISNGETDPSVLVNKASVLSLLERYDEAMVNVMNAQKKIPTEGGYITMGNILGIQKKEEKAIECFKKALEMNPNSGAAFTGIGVSMFFLNRLDESLSNINRSLELQPNAPEPLTQKGSIFSKMNRHDRALEYFNKALENSPGYFNAIINKYYTLRKLNRDEEADKIISDIINENPSISETFDNDFRKENIQHIENKPTSQYITEVENGLRELIEIKMSQFEDWERQRIPKTVLVDAQKRKEVEDSKPMFAHEKRRLIEFLNFGDYIQIFSYGKNWENVFGKIFKDRDKCFGNLKQLIELRNAVQHSRKLDEKNYGHLVILHQYFMFYLKKSLNDNVTT